MCPSCAKLLDRIDQVGTEHTILDNGVYREVGMDDGGAHGAEFDQHIVAVIVSSVISSMTPPPSARRTVPVASTATFGPSAFM